jgi:hypothetical protein
MAPSTAQRSRILPVVTIIILVDYLIPIQWFNGQEVAWLVLPAAWWPNLCPDCITSVLREMLAGAFNLPRAGCLQIGAIDLIPKGMGVVPPPIVHLVVGCYQKFVPNMSGREPTSPKKANSFSCGRATSAGIVKSGEL